jgi:hypothetical protein
VYCRSLDLALASARRAIELDPADPAAVTTLAHTLFFRGDYTAGWRLPFWRVKLPWPAVPEPRREWDGSPLPPSICGRTLLVIADLGYGDTLQWARFLPWAAERCPDIALACAPSLADILRPLLPVRDRVYTHWFDAHFAAFICFSELPRLARAEPGPVSPYISPEPTTVAKWRQWLNGLTPPGRRRVGLCWSSAVYQGQGGNDMQHTRRRSISFAQLEQLIGAFPEITFVSLQCGAPARENTIIPGLDVDPPSWAETAGLVAALDLVITVDTSVVHLAGAMSKPTWVMLNYQADWHWGRPDQTTAPWYPTARLFRQPAPGRWDLVIEEIVATLKTD